jgi:basic membrane protein A
MKKILTGLGAVALTFALVACGSGTPDPSDTPTDSGTPEPESKGLYCVISDGGSFEDKSFNQSALDGAKQAENELGVEIKAIESAKAEDYKANIDAAIEAKCNLIITVGFNLAEATQVAAEANPDVDFAIIDDSSIALPNVKPLLFNVAEGAYLAGYLGAGFSKTGVLAAYGGLAIPPVQLYVDGVYQGVQAYNEAKGTEVKLLGWDAEDPSKMQVVGDFNDASKAKQIVETFLNQGADIVLGSVGEATPQAVLEHEAYYMMGDVDAYYTHEASYLPHLLTSILKQITPAVFDTIKAHTEGNFSNESYLGTLANGGVDIAPYHDLEGDVPEELKAEVQKLREDIISGTLKITSDFAPQAGS